SPETKAKAKIPAPAIATASAAVFHFAAIIDYSDSRLLTSVPDCWLLRSVSCHNVTGGPDFGHVDIAHFYREREESLVSRRRSLRSSRRHAEVGRRHVQGSENTGARNHCPHPRPAR